MIRLATLALAAALMPASAIAGCQSVPDLVAGIRPTLPATAFVGPVPSGSLPTVLAWLESEGLPHEADRIVQVAGDRGVALILVRGAQACDGTQIVKLMGPAAASLIGTVRRLRELRGWGSELGA